MGIILLPIHLNIWNNLISKLTYFKMHVFTEILFKSMDLFKTDLKQSEQVDCPCDLIEGKTYSFLIEGP